MSDSREVDYTQLKKLMSQDKILLLVHKKYKGLRKLLIYGRCGLSYTYFDKAYRKGDVVLQFGEFGPRIGVPLDWQDVLADYNSGKMEEHVKKMFKDLNRELNKSVDETVDNEIEKIKTKIKDYKDDLFGITLFYQGTKLLHPSSVLKAVNFDKHYKSIIDRGKSIISKAEEILKEVKISHNTDRFREIIFPPLTKDMPPIIDNIPRLKLLIETYDELFPGRDKAIPLTDREIMLIMNRVIEKF